MVHQSADARLAVIGLHIDFSNPVSSQNYKSSKSEKRSRIRDLKPRQDGNIKATLLETVFAKISEIAVPDASTHTDALLMSRLAAALAGTNRLLLPHAPRVSRGSFQPRSSPSLLRLF